MIALMISFNTETEEILYQRFDGEDCLERVRTWAHPNSFVWQDFPAHEGWVHMPCWDTEALDAFGKSGSKDFEKGIFWRESWLPPLNDGATEK